MNTLTNHIYSWFSNENNVIKNLANNEVINIANELNGLFSETTDINHKINLPKIAVVGTQSSGKSSVLNAIMSMDILPTGKNMVTRTPLDIRLHKNNLNSAWIELGNYGTSGWICEKKVILTLPNTNKDEIKSIREYISMKTNELAGDQMNISKSPIFIKIFSPNVPDLSLVDLPGLIMVACTDKGQPKDIPEQIENLIESYITDKNTITLLIVQARSDIETDLGLAITKKYNCEKIMGILTKPDLMNIDSHIGNYLLNNISKDLMLDNGYFVVKNGVGGENMNDVGKNFDIEKKYFSSHYEYSKSLYVNKIGYSSVIKELVKVLIEAIQTNLPDALKKLSDIESDILKKQNLLGKALSPTKEGQFIEINSYINEFNKIFNNCIESANTNNNIGKSIKCIFEQFKSDIDNISPFNGSKYSDEYFKEIISSFEGYHMSTCTSAINLLEKCLTDPFHKPISLLRDTCISCNNNISKIIIKNIQSILIDTNFSRYPLLSTQLINQICSNLINPYNKISCGKIDELLQIEIDFIWTDDSKFLELLNKTLILGKNDMSNLRKLLEMYFTTIKNNVKNNIPKIIMSFLIRNLQQNMINYLSINFIQESKLELLKEDENVEKQRKYCDSMLLKIQIIKKLITDKKLNN